MFVFFWKIVNFGYKNYAIFFRILVRPSKLCLMKCLSKLTRFIIMKRNRYILSVSFLYSKNLVKFWSISPKHFIKHTNLHPKISVSDLPQHWIEWIWQILEYFLFLVQNMDPDPNMFPYNLVEYHSECEVVSKHRPNGNQSFGLGQHRHIMKEVNWQPHGFWHDFSSIIDLR